MARRSWGSPTEEVLLIRSNHAYIPLSRFNLSFGHGWSSTVPPQGLSRSRCLGAQPVTQVKTGVPAAGPGAQHSGCPKRKERRAAAPWNRPEFFVPSRNAFQPATAGGRRRERQTQV